MEHGSGQQEEQYVDELLNKFIYLLSLYVTLGRVEAVIGRHLSRMLSMRQNRLCSTLCCTFIYLF